jgi:uncharacterized membrane protein YozB (DUF420 family)
MLAVHPIVHVNASLNAIATVLLVVGYLFIKQGRPEAHKRAMFAAFGVSIAFLLCYLYYHYQVGSVRFTHSGLVRHVYLTVLASHIVLAALVPFLAIWTIYLGYRSTACHSSENSDRPMPVAEYYRDRHVRWARWTFPIWLYVSVTGVIVYVMLYHLWPPAGL